MMFSIRGFSHMRSITKRSAELNKPKGNPNVAMEQTGNAFLTTRHSQLVRGPSGPPTHPNAKCSANIRRSRRSRRIEEAEEAEPKKNRRIEPNKNRRRIEEFESEATYRTEED